MKSETCLRGERSRSPPPLGCWAHFLPSGSGHGEGKGVVPTLRTKWSFWFPVSLFLSLTCISPPPPLVVKKWVPLWWRRGNSGRRENGFSLSHTVGQGEKVEHPGTTLSPENCPASFKVQLNVTFSKSSDYPFSLPLLVELVVPSAV